MIGKNSFVSVGTIQLVGMYRKVSSVQFELEKSCMVVAARQAEFLFYRCIGRHGRGFGALAEVIGISANPIPHKEVIAAEKLVHGDLLKAAELESPEVVWGRKFFRLVQGLWKKELTEDS